MNMKTVFGTLAACAALAIGVGVSTQANADHHKPAKAGHLKIGEAAPDFKLVDHAGKEHVLSDYTEDGKVVVLEWFNPGCPFVKLHYKDDTQTMNKLAKKYKEDNVVWLRINSGAEGKQGADRSENIEFAEAHGMKGPILFDADGKVGKTYGAKTTPHMYVIDTEGNLRYQGALDNIKGMTPGDTNYVDNAVRAILAGETVDVTETKPYGCSVKY